MTTNPNEPEKDAVDRTAQEILTAFEAKDAAKVNSYYARDAIIATAGRPAAKDGPAVSKAIRDDLADPNFKMISHTRRPKSPPRVNWPTAAARTKSLLRTRRPNGGAYRGHLLDRLQEAAGRKLEGGGRFRSLARLVRPDHPFAPSRSIT